MASASFTKQRDWIHPQNPHQAFRNRSQGLLSKGLFLASLGAKVSIYIERHKCKINFKIREDFDPRWEQDPNVNWIKPSDLCSRSGKRMIAASPALTTGTHMSSLPQVLHSQGHNKEVRQESQAPTYEPSLHPACRSVVSETAVYELEGS